MPGSRRKAGRLGPQVEGYRAWLAHRGYTPQTVRNMLKDLGQVGAWMSGAGLEAAQLDEDAMVAFLASRQAAGRRRALGPRAMMPLLSYLREAGVTPAARPPQSPLGALLVEAFFVSLKRKRLLYAVVKETFRQLIDNAGIGAGAPSPPRLHDLRHTFAVTTLLGWYQAPEDVQSKIPSLSAYLGHREPSSTYWYFSAAPELLALAAARQGTAWSAARS